MDRIQKFKAAHQRFLKALHYIIENEAKLKADLAKWAKVRYNFEAKFEKPLDEAWLALSNEERKSLSSLYLHRRAQVDPIVKKVLETFKGKIIKVEENKNTST